MAKKKTEKFEKIEREYTIPLREKCRPVPRYRKTEKAMKTIKEFIAKHMKVIDRDIKKVKVDSYLNETVWQRGIKNPPHKIKVRAIKEGDIVRVEAVELPNNLKYKKLREERTEKKAKEVGEKKKKEKVAKEAPKSEEEEKTRQDSKLKKEEAEKREEDKEKKTTTIEAGKKMEKLAAKKMKHEKVAKASEPKHQHRMALQK